MKYTTLAALCATMFAFTGCVKDDTADVAPAAGKTVIGAGIADTRTSLGENVDGVRKVYWSNGDRINVNGAASEALADVPAETSSVQFTFDGILNLPYSAVYPASIYTDASTVTLPATQAYAAGSFGANAAPMAAYINSDGNLKFHHLCAVVKLSITKDSDADQISYVEFRGKAGEQVSGKFAIDYENAALTAAGVADDADKAVRVTVKRSLGDEALDVYIVVPAGKYAQGFTVKVIDAFGHYMEKSTADGKTLEKGKIMAMPAFAFVPTATELGVEIQSAADLVQFAKDYNAGKYAGMDPAIYTLTDDIVFNDETNAAFESIGVTDNYFNGWFNGNGKTIKNWVTSKPLFAYTGGAGNVTDLTIDSTCKATITADYNASCTATDAYFGVMVGRHKGDMANCHCNADITADENITFAYTGLHIGSIAGYASEGVVENSTASGSITMPATLAMAANANISVGGIIGYNKNGRVENCTSNVAITDASVSSTHHIGGIVGANSATVTKSKNEGKLIFSSARKVNGVNDASRYANIGGVVGRNFSNEAVLTESTNIGDIVSTSNVKMQRIGGIAGTLDGNDVEGTVVGGTLANNTNTGAITTSAGVRQLALGGLYGEINYNSTFDFSTDTSSATGAISVSSFEASDTNTYVYTGGLIGHINQAYNATLAAPKCTANIMFDFTKANSKAYILSIGGIVGHVGVMTSGKETGGLLTVTDAETSGTIAVNQINTYKMEHKTAAYGGIVGQVATGGAKLSGCKNSIQIVAKTTCAASKQYAQFVGGIVGVISGGDSEITNCENSGALRSDHYNNNNWTGGDNYSGAVGGIIGNYGYKNTFDGTLKITDCHCTADKLRAYRGMVGGIAGYLRNATVSDCTNVSNLIDGNHAYVGGIVSIVENTTIDNCTATCNMSGQSAGSEVYSGGGIVGILYTASSVKNCAYNGTITKNSSKTGETAGLIAGSTIAGTTISDCKAGGTLLGTAATEENIATLIAGDTNITPTGCTYWNGK